MNGTSRDRALSTRRLLVFGFVLGRVAMTGGAPAPQSFDSKGVSIQYTVEGKGEPVVLVHGLFASAQLNWRLPGVIRALSRDYQVIAMDVRGHGHSGAPAKEEAY